MDRRQKERNGFWFQNNNPTLVHEKKSL